MDIISYKSAKALGLKRYFTGKPCKRGHVAERNVASCACVECAAAVTKKWGDKNPELKYTIYREWVEARPGYNAEWARNNPISHKASARKWYQANAEHAIEKSLEWAKQNPEKSRARCRNRNARRKAAMGSHTAQEVLEMLEKQKWKCVGCGVSIKKKRHIDHIIPLARGGQNDIGNLQGLCPSCNCSKNAKDPLEWAKELGRLL